MSAEFWTGVLTIPLALVILVTIYLVGGWLIALSRKAWQKIHFRMLSRVDLRKNLYDLDEPNRPEYQDAANELKAALMKSPRLYTATGLGWMILIVRDERKSNGNE